MLRRLGDTVMQTENKDFTTELRELINKHSKENGSDTPDWLLAIYLQDCLDVWNRTIVAREKWYGRELYGKPAFVEVQDDIDE